MHAEDTRFVASSVDEEECWLNARIHLTYSIYSFKVTKSRISRPSNIAEIQLTTIAMSMKSEHLKMKLKLKNDTHRWRLYQGEKTLIFISQQESKGESTGEGP